MSLLVTTPTADTLRPRVTVERVVPVGATTTYHYRTVGWAYGTTTDVAEIPAGATRIGSVTT